MTPREAKRCDCCAFMERSYRSVEYRQDGVVFVSLNLCRRCSTAVEDAIARAMEDRHHDRVRV